MRSSINAICRAALFVLILLLFGLPAFADSVQIAEDQATTGVSAVACTLPIGYEQLAVKTTRSGTAATIEVECNLGDNAFITLTGAGLPITGTADSRSITTWPCYQVRINVTVCTACTVNAWCAYSLIPE